MGPPRKKKPLRTADGRPEMRSPDQILRDAVSDISKDLPNTGRKLDLDAYFRGGAEDRVANRLLKDNGVLPQHLHERKEAETLREKAEQVLDEDAERLLKASEDISAEVSIPAGFLGETSFQTPEGICLVAEDPAPTAIAAQASLKSSVDGIRVFMRKRSEALDRFRVSLDAVNTAIDRSNQQIAATGKLMPAYPAAFRVDTQEQIKLTASRLPESIMWPESDVEAVRLALKSARSPFERLKSVFQRGT